MFDDAAAGPRSEAATIGLEFEAPDGDHPLPVAGGVALGIGADPLLLAIPVALAATCAFMLPVATPPNAIAYSSGYVTMGEMIKGGIWLNLFGLVLNTAVTMTLAVWVFGIAF